MGKITDVLNKVQKSRRDYQGQKISDVFHIKDALQDNSKIVIMVIIVVVAIAVVFVNNKIYNLEKSLKMQEKRINGLTDFMVNAHSFSDSQIQDLNFRLKNETDDRKIQVNDLALIDNVYYINIEKSILADTHQIDYLDKYTKYLKSEIEKIYFPDSQTNVSQKSASTD